MNAKISVFLICVRATIYLLLYNLHDCVFNPNKSGLFEGSFFLGGGCQFDTPSYFKRNLSNINISLYNC